jgi:hypothetical protein
MKIKVHGSENYIKFKNLFSTLSKVFFCEISDQFDSSEVNGHIIFSDNHQTLLPEGPALVYLNNFVIEKSLTTNILLNSDLSGVKFVNESFSTRSFELKRAVNLDSGYRIIAKQEENAIWYIDENQTYKRYYSLIPPCNLENYQSLKDKFNSKDFIQVLPIIAFLRELEEPDSIIYPAPKASIIIDDPNLHRSKYGFIDYNNMVADSKLKGYHINLATIPLDLFYSSKKALKLIKTNNSQLSLVIHGNNHTSEELMVNSYTKSYSKLLTIKNRVEKYYKKYGVRIGEIIIPPHGVMSREFLRSIAVFDILGACISRPFPWYSGKSGNQVIKENENYSRMFPADIIEGTPIVPRMKDLEDVPFKLLLHIPLIPYYHHNDFKKGIDKFGEIVKHINKYADVTWTSLKDIFHSNYIIKIDNKKATVYLFSKQVNIHLPEEIENVRFQIINNIGPSREMELWIDGQKLAMDYSDDNIYSSPEILTKDKRNFMIRINSVSELDMQNLTPERTSLKAIIRRILTEVRDILAPVMS